MKIKLLLALSFCVALRATAQISPAAWTYQTLGEKALLIVIATPTNVQVTGEQAELDPKHMRTELPDGRQIPVKVYGVETTFEVLTVLKGQADVKTFILHHYDRGNAIDRLRMSGDPRFVYFEVKDKKRYLMFLKQEADGRYAAISGQYDPQDSISELANRYP